jgi:hypothetical protein
VGDGEFVKDFFEQQKADAEKKLAIIYEGGDNDLHWYAKAHIKVCLIDPRPLDARKTHDVFSFFFTSNKNYLDDRKEPRAPLHVVARVNQPSHEPVKVEVQDVAVDKARIASVMAQVFKKDGMAGKSGVSRSHPFSVGQVVAVISTIVLAPGLIYGVALLLSFLLLGVSGKLLLSGKLAWANRCISYSKEYISGANNIVQLTTPVLSLLGLQQQAEDQQHVLSLLSDAAQAEEGVIVTLESGKAVMTGILFPQAAPQPKGIADVVALHADLSQVADHLALVQAQLDALLATHRVPFQLPVVQTYGHKALTSLAKIRLTTSYAERFLTMYPSVAGFRKKQTYLVLLQNSMELRSTGGFIGSLLLLTFEDGKISDMQVQDVYTADGQLKGHIDPPLPIREILGQEHWYLRDSNWDPDFKVAGEQAAYFYQKELGTDVDGVVAISLPFVTKLLEATGPIELSDFSDRVSASNLFAKSLLYTQTDFFAGSTQKKDFLGSLMNALLLRITGDSSVSSGNLLSVFATSLDAKDLQFYFNDASLERLIQQWGWGGGVGFGPCLPVTSGSPCISDGVGLVSVNLGVNKVNYFIKQEALSSITILDDGSVQQTLTLNIHNTSPSDTINGGGTYQAYLRFLYPADTQLFAATVDGQSLNLRDDRQKTPPQSPYVAVEHAPMATIFNIPLAVDPKAQRQVTVSTIRKNIVTFPSSAMYQFAVRKQPGVDTLPWHVTIQYPTSWTETSEANLAKEGSLEYNTDLTKDGLLEVVFGK